MNGKRASGGGRQLRNADRVGEMAGRIRDLREKRRLTVRQMAQRMGRSESVYSRMERNLSIWYVNDVFQAAEILGVSPATLLGVSLLTRRDPDDNASRGDMEAVMERLERVEKRLQEAIGQ